MCPQRAVLALSAPGQFQEPAVAPQRPHSYPMPWGLHFDICQVGQLWEKLWDAPMKGVGMSRLLQICP